MLYAIGPSSNLSTGRHCTDKIPATEAKLTWFCKVCLEKCKATTLLENLRESKHLGVAQRNHQGGAKNLYILF